MLRDILRGETDITATADVISHVSPDVLILTGIDYDADAAALTAYARLIAESGGPDYAYHASQHGNSGRATGLDIDGDGLLGGPRDAHGYGRFAGQGAMAVLSIHSLSDPDTTGVNALLSEVPGATRPDGTSEAVWSSLRLMERGGWTVTVNAPTGPFEVWAAYGTPPVFDGPEDRNGLRNAAQMLYWVQRADAAGETPVVLAGDLNVDPVDGEGLKKPVRALLEHPFFLDPAPVSQGAEAAATTGPGATHAGAHRFDTVDWSQGPGNLRVDYVLPSRDWIIAGSGVFWPDPEVQEIGLLGEKAQIGSRHRLVWVDLVRKH